MADDLEQPNRKRRKLNTPINLLPDIPVQNQEQPDEKEPNLKLKNSENPLRDISFIFRFPVELVLKIIESISRPADILAMSLTCKTLSGILTAPKFAFMTPPEKEDLLRRLERDLCVTHYLCSRCTKLHVFDQNPLVRINDSSLHRQPTISNSEEFITMMNWTRGSRRLDYANARLLVNNLRYGPSRGLAVNEFCSNDWIRFSDLHASASASENKDRPLFEVGRWNVMMEMKLSQDNKLLLKATHTIQGDIEECELGLRNPEAILHRLCQHTFVFQCFPLQFPEGLNPPSTVPLVLPELSTPWGCYCCASEWTVRHTTVEGGVWTTIESHHLFGDISRHDDLEWLSMVEPKPPRTISDMPMWEPGSILELWNSAT